MLFRSRAEKKRPELTAFSYIISEQVDLALHCMERAAESMDIPVRALCFDGLILEPKSPSVDINAYVRLAELMIYDHLGYALKIEKKEWAEAQAGMMGDDDISPTPEDDDYAPATASTASSSSSETVASVKATDALPEPGSNDFLTEAAP